MKEHYILPEIVERSKEEYINTGVLYVVLALLFANEYQTGVNTVLHNCLICLMNDRIQHGRAIGLVIIIVTSRVCDYLL